ncbi:MAG TPA: IucA/IucC family protein [Pseudonocardiaceae bacterium]|nr:IucA/IucC family protein [Pseudonocardiaceae bacterium]
MTAVRPDESVVDDHRAERDLLARVLDTLLREDFQQIRSTGTRTGDRLRFRLGPHDAELSVRPGRFLSPIEVREPVLVVDGQPYRGLAEVLGRLRAGVDPADLPGFDDFTVECAQTLNTVRSQQEHRADTLGLLAGATRRGPAGSLYYDTLAAYLDHPVYPTGRCRFDLSQPELRRYAPEFHPLFALRWLSLPAESVDRQGVLPDWWPTDGDRAVFPVHPLTADRALAGALREAGLTDARELTDVPARPVMPTLSMRTVAVLDDPTTHVKLPLPTSTLGRRNRRGIKPGTLPDGAITQRLLTEVLAREARFPGRVLLADEQTYGQGGHDQLAYLVRRHPDTLADTEIVALAALLAPAPDGRLVLHDLADRYFAGEPFALLDACLELLFDWQATLLTYGIALESHQQNISLLLDRAGGRTRTRLLFRDNDGPRLHQARLTDTLGPAALSAAGLAELDDTRMLVDSLDPLLDMFITITVHLCAAAPMFALARRQTGEAAARAELHTGLQLIRARLEEASRRCSAADARLLRARLLDADTLPVKAMVTAGTLLTKQRSGAVDINKFYLRSGPNYLRTDGR